MCVGYLGNPNTNQLSLFSLFPLVSLSFLSALFSLSRTHPHAKLPPELALPSDRHLDRRRSRSTPTSALFKAGQLLLGVGRRKRRFGRQKGAVVPPVGTAVYGGDGVLSLVSFDPLLPLVVFRLGLKQVFKVLRPVFADLASKILVTVRAVFRPVPAIFGRSLRYESCSPCFKLQLCCWEFSQIRKYGVAREAHSPPPVAARGGASG